MKYRSSAAVAASEALSLVTRSIREVVGSDVAHRSHRIALKKYDTDLSKISKNRKYALEEVVDSLRISMKNADIILDEDADVINIKEH